MPQRTMNRADDYLIGLVLICPITTKQIAIHKGMIKFSYWDGGLAGGEVDVHIPECPVCDGRHTISVPLE